MANIIDMVKDKDVLGLETEISKMFQDAYDNSDEIIDHSEELSNIDSLHTKLKELNDEFEKVEDE